MVNLDSFQVHEINAKKDTTSVCPPISGKHQPFFAPRTSDQTTNNDGHFFVLFARYKNTTPTPTPTQYIITH